MNELHYIIVSCGDVQFNLFNIYQRSLLQIMKISKKMPITLLEVKPNGEINIVHDKVVFTLDATEHSISPFNHKLLARNTASTKMVYNRHSAKL